MDFANLKPEILEKLAAACHGETGELDLQHISLKFDPLRSGLLEIVRNDLLDGVDAKKDIRAELHRLNVYGLSIQIPLGLFLLI